VTASGAGLALVYLIHTSRLIPRCGRRGWCPVRCSVLDMSTLVSWLVHRMCETLASIEAVVPLSSGFTTARRNSVQRPQDTESQAVV